MSPINKEKALISFKKTHSLIAKIISMIEENKYCVDVMQQNLAAIGLLKSAHQSLMESHLNTCFLSAMETKNKKMKEQMVQEILTVSKLANK